jgi:predicted TIM-barrel fold metal-dependent hydrolase
MLEAGFAWVPAALWSMDEAWLETRAQTLWVKRPPSEYVIERVKFASQPEDEPRPKDGLAKTFEWMHAEQTLMFATDYPHWDWDDPAETFKHLPRKLRERIFSKNASELFRA